MTDEQLEQLMYDLTRPFYVLRMANAKINPPSPTPSIGLRKSAEGSAKTARKEIREVLVKHGLLND